MRGWDHWSRGVDRGVLTVGSPPSRNLKMPSATCLNANKVIEIQRAFARRENIEESCFFLLAFIMLGPMRFFGQPDPRATQSWLNALLDIIGNRHDRKGLQ